MPSVSNLVTPANPPGTFIPNVPNVARWDFTAAQILTLNSSPIDILPPLTGYFYYVFLAVYYKNSGPVFTTGAQNLMVQWKASTPLNNVAMSAVGLLDQTVASRFQMPASSNLADDAAAAIGSKGMRLFLSADPGGTGSTFSMMLTYYILPAFSTNIPSI